MNIATYREWLHGELAEYLKARITQAQELTSTAAIHPLVEYIETLCLAGGKRMRPYLAQLMYWSAGGQPLQPAFMALELFHIFCLVHDDIMDHSPLRHGIPTVEAWWQTQLPELPTAKQEDIARSQAILVGDLLIAWCYDLLRTASISSARSLKTLRQFTQMHSSVVIGQMLDIHLASHPQPDTKAHREMVYLKTSSYSFISPLLIGLAFKKDSHRLTKFSQQFGKEVGHAFQLQDDLFDLIGSSTSLGKPIQHDSHTLLRQAQAKGTSLAEIQQTTRQEISAKIRAAHQLVDNAPLAQKYVPDWHAFLEYIESRQN